MRRAIILTCVPLALCACAPAEPPAAPAAAGEARWLRDATADWLPAQPTGWPDGTHDILEITGSGIALFDADEDGDLDLLQVRQPPPGRPGEPAPNRLWVNDGGRFRERTASGLEDPGFGQGVAVGDVDGDGRPDVYVTNAGQDALYLRRGAGFEPAPLPADPRWSSSAAFCDYDADGDLDLYVARYLRHDPAAGCFDDAGAPDYCGPGSFDGEADSLLRNDGGRLVDATRAAGITPADGGRSAKGLGVVCTDLSGDGRADFYVANDGEPNQLWVQRADGTFEEQAMLRGAAVNRFGQPESSMGIAVADSDRDGRLDLFLTHLGGQNNTLYAGGEAAVYMDRTAELGAAADDFPRTGFGCAFSDLDLDGDVDLLVANGRVFRDEPLPGARVGEFWNAYAEPDFLFVNDGAGRFALSEPAPNGFGARIEVSRGLAVGDLDGDGDPDVVVSNHDGSLRVYENVAGDTGAHWVALELLDAGRPAHGAQLSWSAGDGPPSAAALLPAASYLSHHEARVRLGLGAATSLRLTVRWLDGSRERYAVDEVDRIVRIERGAGEPS